MTIKASDYDIVEQLKKQEAQISLFDLIRSFDKNQNMLEKFLAETHVPVQIEVHAIDTFMGNILAPNVITFSNEDLQKIQMRHNNAYFINIMYKSTWVPKVLIDGESGVNIIPLAVARKLKFDEWKLIESSLVIRAFDGARRKALEEISLDIEVGPVTFDTTF